MGDFREAAAQAGHLHRQASGLDDIASQDAHGVGPGDDRDTALGQTGIDRKYGLQDLLPGGGGSEFWEGGRG